MTKPIRLTRSTIFSFLVLILTLNLCSDANARPVTNKAELRRLSRSFSTQLDAQRSQQYYDLLDSEAVPQKRLNENPDIQLMFINNRGCPVFYVVDNLTAAQTISTDDVWPGGGGGLSLTGSATVLGELGVWDAGGVLTTHQEFGGRVTQMDGAGGTHYHSTHVAGTMVAEGVVSTAKGMSFEAFLAAYDWGSDNSEMATAAADGMNVSSHSYGWATGWRYDGAWYWYGDISVSTTEDYGFGYYNSEAQAWDQIAYNAPYYTIVKSAGNDRGDNGPGTGGGHYVWQGGDWVWSTAYREPDGGVDGYDCIPWNANAKNIITVGAVNDLPGGYANPAGVVMSSFSSWGPTDDGRIKPDLVANGTSLYSCLDTHNSSYSSLSGTSMSTPNLSGSLNLLVRYYETTHEDETPLSSTMKAILINTADEAGSGPGPDYKYGWGLMNTLHAAQLIGGDVADPELIIEESISFGQTDEYFFESDGADPIRITLAWTDLPGSPPAPEVDPENAMLVIDLDLRLEHVSSATVYYPYVLDPSIPSVPATTGDNDRDNAERIDVDSPSAGTHRVTVSHVKGLMGITYSLVRTSGPYVPPCDCGVWGDVTGDGLINPVDVTYMVQHVYLDNDMRVQPPDCPLEAGDVNCDESVNPVDMTLYVQYVYLTNDMFCPDPCD